MDQAEQLNNQGNNSQQTERIDAQSKIIRLTPTWSQIEGLQPPLTNEAKEQIRDVEVVRSAFVEPQFEQVLRDAQSRFLATHPKGIGYRAIMTSKEGDVVLRIASTDTPYTILDMQETVAQGGEKDGDTIRVGVQLEKHEPFDALDQHRVFQYLEKGVHRILATEDADARTKLTPAILVYDLEQLVPEGGYNYKFKNPEDKGGALLALYPLDIDSAK